MKIMHTYGMFFLVNVLHTTKYSHLSLAQRYLSSESNCRSKYFGARFQEFVLVSCGLRMVKFEINISYSFVKRLSCHQKKKYIVTLTWNSIFSFDNEWHFCIILIIKGMIALGFKSCN